MDDNDNNDDEWINRRDKVRKASAIGAPSDREVFEVVFFFSFIFFSFPTDLCL